MASGVTQSGTITASGVAVTAGTVPNVASSTAVKQALTYFGYSFRATAAAVVRIRQKDATGPILSDLAIPINDMREKWYGPQGRQCKDDIYVEVVSGTVEGVVFYG